MKKIMLLLLVFCCVINITACNQVDTKTNDDYDISFTTTTTVKEKTFFATVIAENDKTLTVRPAQGSAEASSADKIIVPFVNSETDFINVGDNLKIKYDGQILETYPAQIKTVLKIEVVSRAESQTNVMQGYEFSTYNYRVKYLSDATPIWTDALNSQYQKATTGIYYMPVYCIKNETEFEEFAQKCVKTINWQYNQDTFNKQFFQDNALLFVYVGTSSGGETIELNRINIDKNNIYAHFDTITDPLTPTEDMAGWLVGVVIENKFIKDHTNFNADLNNPY